MLVLLCRTESHSRQCPTATADISGSEVVRRPASPACCSLAPRAAPGWRNARAVVGWPAQSGPAAASVQERMAGRQSGDAPLLAAQRQAAAALATGVSGPRLNWYNEPSARPGSPGDLRRPPDLYRDVVGLPVVALAALWPVHEVAPVPLLRPVPTRVSGRTRSPAAIRRRSRNAGSRVRVRAE